MTTGVEMGRAGQARLRALVEVTRTFAEHVADQGHLAQTVAEQTGKLFDGYCLLGTWAPDGRAFQIVAVHSPLPEHAAELRQLLGGARPVEPDGASLAARVARTGSAVLVEDLHGDDWRERLTPEQWALITRYDLHGLIAAPLRSKGSVLGTLIVGRFGLDAPPFDALELDLLQVLADHAAQTIRGAQLFDAVQVELSEHRRTRESLDRSEEQLRQAAKMEAVGRLAGGVAHDFNNILSVVLGYSDCLLETLMDNPALREDVQQIRDAGVRAAALTQQLLAFSRKQVLAPQAVDLNQTVSALGPMLRRLLGEDVELHFSLDAELQRCLVDPGQIEQIVMNLIVNARDAMPEGGQITIETGNALLDQEYVAAHPDAKPGQHVVLSVTDTGVGMSAATLARIFEPFFTTKPKGVGTGLGLSTVYGIVHQSGGNIWVYSEPGKGTCFKIQFPTTASVTVAARPSHVPSAEVDLSGSETILVVEDDPQVRELVRAVLSRAGYRVLDAANGEEAERLWARRGPAVALLITDVVMPRASGPQVAERLGRLDPRLKVLYMSGYAEHAIVNHGVLEPGIEFIPKPITPRALLRRVRQVLGGVSARAAAC